MTARSNEVLYGPSTAVEVGGRPFLQSHANEIGGNVNDYEEPIKILKDMMLEGYPVLLIKPAYDADDNFLQNWTSVFIPHDAQDEIWDEYVRRRDGE